MAYSLLYSLSRLQGAANMSELRQAMTLTMPEGNLDLAGPRPGYHCPGRESPVQESLYKMPIEELDAVLDACEVPTGEHKLLLHILAHDPRMYVRKRVAGVLRYNIIPDSHEMETLIYRLICDMQKSVSDAALSGLMEYLRASSDMTRTRLLCGWARSSHLCARRAVVNALMEEIPAVGISGVIEHLAEDPSASIRQGTVACAGLYHDQDPDRMMRVIRRLARDEIYEVRSTASSVLDFMGGNMKVSQMYETKQTDPDPDRDENLPGIPAPRAA